MEFIRNFSQLQAVKSACVATIGNFDGVHLGHQKVLQQLANQAEAFALPSVAIIFEPQPQEFFAPEAAPARLTRLREKLIVMHRHHYVDKILCLRFNAQFAALSADTFIQQVLVAGLGVRHLVVGDDFRFGQGRQGDFTTLQQAGQHYGFTVEYWHTFLLEGQRVSSTRVRQALTQGNLPSAARLLGRPYTLYGRVSHGQRRGRQIGFPTANIHLHRRTSPLQGVFAIYLRGISATPLAGVANLGKRPTVDGHQLLLEVHLFDFNLDIYGCAVEVEFIHKLRDEKRFSSLDALKKQIQQDVYLAQTAFK